MHKLITATFIALLSINCAADCNEECKAAYDECIAEHPSPNGEKICGQDYSECKMQCAERGESTN